MFLVELPVYSAQKYRACTCLPVVKCRYKSSAETDFPMAETINVASIATLPSISNAAAYLPRNKGSFMMFS